MFDVNYWGAVHVSQEAVGFFREENSPQGGRLIQNSAGVGLVTLPTLGFYASTKHTLEGFTETLHKELNPAWNIEVSFVLFGGFVTEFATGSFQMIPQHSAYADNTNAAAVFRRMFSGSTVESQKKLGFGDPAKGIQKVYELSKLENPPLRLLLGKDINQYVKEYIAQLTKEVDEYEAWSDNLGYVDN
uniref:Zn(2)-C6 fungal-type domain-containing protein n=1 Tax=Ganoderma boninense TaxID=34458 RepID=A0A5K1JZ70_9APHY|nr:Zn(2)-C6 fungal-type domain-containing protein [Ganoderma boninense]